MPGPVALVSRGRVVIVAAVALIAASVIAWMVPVPYVLWSPGPAVDTLAAPKGKQIVTISGRSTYPTTGRLDLTTVRQTPPDGRVGLAAMLRGWIDPSQAVLPRSYVYPPTVTAEQVEQENAVEMTGSQRDAVAAGLREAGVPVTERVQVQAIEKDAPALGKLEVADLVLTVDGTAVTDPGQLRSLVRAHAPGAVLRFGVERGKRRLQVRVTAGPATDDPAVAAVGITPAVGFDSAVDVSINLPEQIGGPSAGMIFALAIVDKLSPGGLTGGRIVAGTGTVDPNGAVGPIGGIQQKVYGARDSGATVFLAPAGDCAAAAAAGVGGVTVYRITTLHDSVTVLSELVAHKPVTVPVCGR